MFYKIIKDNKVIDVLDGLTYVKYQPRNCLMLLCGEGEAQGIVSSDGNTFWHERTLYNFPISGYDTVEAVEIDEYEYHQLKALNGKTPSEIIDEFLLSLIKEGVL